MTEPERRLWSLLRSKQFQTLKFRRQHGIGPYVVDFYCSTNKIVIEVDGDTHGEEIEKIKDKRKEDFLCSLGIRVIRYTNREIMQNLDGVLENLWGKLST